MREQKQDATITVEPATTEAINGLETTNDADFVSKPSFEGPVARHDSRDSSAADRPSGRVGSTKGVVVLSPRILSASWGQIEVEGVGKVKDVKLWPGGGRAWDWDETGTRHSPGIQMADTEELLNYGATVVVLSRGMQERLEVPKSTVDALRARGVEVHIAITPIAVALYNNLLPSTLVAGLFHSTC
jgi:hypothetical protein